MARTKKKFEIVTERKIGGFHPDSGAVKTSTYTTYAFDEEDARKGLGFKLRNKKRRETIVSVAEVKTDDERKKEQEKKKEAVDGKEDKVEEHSRPRLTRDDVDTDSVKPGKATKAEKKKKGGKAESKPTKPDGQEGEDWGENF